MSLVHTRPQRHCERDAFSVSKTAAVRISEADFTVTVIKMAQRFGWRCAHFRPCRTEKGWRTAVQGDGAGFPDLVLARPPRLIFAELKADSGRLTDEQNAWLIALGWPREVEIEVWRPRDIETVERVLSSAAHG
jgi:hypothetical protein